jgi:hypothetical protein
VEAVSLEQRLLLHNDDTLEEASHAVEADVEGVGAGEECQSVGIVDVDRASVASRQRHQNIVNNVENLRKIIKT